MPNQVDLQLTTRQSELGSVNEKERSVEAVVASESPVAVFDPQSGRVIDEVLVARGGEFPEQVPLLDSHFRFSSSSVLGSGIGFRLEGNQWVGRATFMDGDPEVERIWNRVRQRHLRDVSIGYVSNEFTDIAPGETRLVQGRRFTANARTLRITTSWRVRELSVTPIGADEMAKIRSALTHLPQEQRQMKPKLRRFLELLGLRKDASDEVAQGYLDGQDGVVRKIADHLAQDEPALDKVRSLGYDVDEHVVIVDSELHRERSGLPTQQPATPAPEPAPAARNEPVTPAPEPVNADQIRQEAIAAERQRQASIRQAAEDDVPAELVERAISENWTLERAHGAFLTAVRDRREAPVVDAVGGPAIHSRSHETDCNANSLEAALLIRSGLDPTQHHVRRVGGQYVNSNPEDDSVRRAADNGQRYHDMALIDIMRECMRIDGVRSIPRNRSEFLDAAAWHQRSAVSGGTFVGVFSTAFSAQLLASFDATPDSTEPWTTSSDVPNFQTNERTMLNKMGALTKHGRGGIADHLTRADKKEEYKVSRYSAQFVLDEMDIIDDRFGALQQTSPGEIGESARQIRPDLVYSILAANANLSDGVALFHTATHGNLQTTSPFAKATLQTAIDLMMTQQQDGRNLSGFNKVLIVPQALVWDARTVTKSGNLIITGSTNTVQGDLNPIAAENLRIISDSRLDNGVTDPDSGTTHAGSNSTWYLAATGGRHTIEVGYVRGSGRRPNIRSFNLDRGQWGIGWDVKHDIGAKALDYRGLVKSTA